MKDKTAKAILEKVVKDYDHISQEFDQTRKYPWPEFSLIQQFVKGRTLDLGCGNGRLYDFLMKELSDIDYIGMDNNEKLLKHAKYNFPDARFENGDLLNIPIENESLDTIISIAAFHHIPSKKLREESIKEMWFKLKQGGHLILSVWNLFQPKYKKYTRKALFNFFTQLGKYDYNDTFIPWGKSGVERYYHAFTPKEINNLFTDSGFDLVDLFYTKKNEKVSFKESHNIILVCRKI